MDVRADVVTIFDVLGGVPALGTTALRVPPGARSPNLEVDGVVVDTRPRFAFRTATLPVIQVGETFTIAEGPDAATYSIDLIDTVDGEVTELVCTRR